MLNREFNNFMQYDEFKKRKLQSHQLITLSLLQREMYMLRSKCAV